MSKITITIELDANDTKTSGILAALTGAFGGTPITVETPAPKAKAKAVKAEEPKAEEPTKAEDEPKASKEASVASVTVDDVRNAMAGAKRAGKATTALRDILKRHNASMVSDLKPEDYNSVITALKAL